MAPGMDTPQVSKNEIVEGLRALGIGAGARLFVHSSLKAFGRVDGGADAVCDALLDAVAPGGTVAVPTFTWGVNHAREVVVFDVRNDPCEVGIIPETFRRQPGALRSEHVCHSVTAIGPDASGVMGDGVRSFAWGSSMYRLYEMDFLYLFLGCLFDSCTAMHCAEELVQVPYRYYRHFRGSTIVRADGASVPARSVEFVRYTPYANDFTMAERDCEQAGLFRRGKIGNANVSLARMRDIVDVVVEELNENPGYLLTAASQAYLAEDESLRAIKAGR